VELANRFKVSVRTIYRDVEQMLEAGIPIQALAGRTGGFRLVSEDPLESTNPDPDLAFRLYLLGFWKPGKSEGTTAPTNGSKAFRSSFLRLIERVHFDTSDWYWRDEGSAHLQTLRTALQANSMLEVTLRKTRSDPPRTLFLKPLGLVWKSGQWYLIGAPTGGPIQRLSLNAIERLLLTDATFVYPEDFRLTEWWAESVESYGTGPTPVILKVSPGARDELARLSLKSTSRVEASDDGGMTITLFVDRWEWLVPLVASYGSDVVVVEPPALATALVAHLRRAISSYAEAGRDEAATETTFDSDDSRLRTTRGRPQA
jgi:predicted DNA-binding transcriptional regulator YafY